MRSHIAALAVLAVASSAACSGASDGTALPADTLDHDATPAFAGRWYGAVTSRAAREATTPDVVLDVAVLGRNEITFPGMCGDGSGPRARLTSDTTFVVAAHACHVLVDGCDATWNVRGGSGTLLGGTLSWSMQGAANGCGARGEPLDVSFTGARSEPDHGAPMVSLRGPTSTPPQTAIVLDATGSRDPDGRPLSYAWRVTTQPPGATALLGSPLLPTTSFLADLPGSYAVEVTVSAGDGQSATGSVVITVTTPPFDYGPPQARLVIVPGAVPLGAAALLDAGGSYDPDGSTLTFAWRVVAGPPGAAPVLSAPQSARTDFTASVPGSYTVSVTVTARDGQQASATRRVFVAPPGLALAALPHRVAQAAYSRSLDRLVMTDGSPDALYVLDPATGAERAVALPLPPRCLDVSPDGKHALVGHDAHLSYVDLVTGARTDFPVAVAPGACTLGNGWAYVFPQRDWDAVHSVDLATGTETADATNHYAGSAGVLTPDGRTLYAVTTAQSPMDLKRWDVSAGVASFAYEMAYHGDYPVGGAVWMERSGARVFTSAGTAFRTSSVRSLDMVYAGTLSGLSGVTHLDTNDAEIAAIPAAAWWDPAASLADTTVELFNPSYLGPAGQVALPWWAVGGSSFPTHGRFVFYSADGTRKHVVVQADVSSGLLHDTAVVTY
jgi:hypothetical protein